MAKAFSRNQRVAEQMRRELADILMFEVRDPRVQSISLTEVAVTGDMAHAQIYYVASAPSKDTQLGLEAAANFLRSKVAKRMMLRTIPQLHFTYDNAMDNGIKISRLIDQALASNPSQPHKNK